MADISNTLHEKKRRFESVDIDKASKIQVVVCDICGDRGFENALMYCSKCSATAVHQYCLGLQPGIIDDTCDWFCEYCCPLREFDSGGTYTMPATIFVEPSVALEIKSKRDKNVIFHVVEELEPLSILPPIVVPLGNFEEKEKNHLVTLGTHTLNSRGVRELSTSSFIEYPKEIWSGLILVASQTGEITIHSGNCNAMNSNKIGNEGCCIVQNLLMLDEPSSQTDEEIDTHDCIDDTPGKENSSDVAGVRKSVVLPTDSMDHLRCAKRKRNAKAVKFDLIPNLGPDCKRRRSRRRKMSLTSNKEINGCKVSFSSVSAIVDERSDLPSNDLEAVLLKSDMDGMDHDDTFSKTSLVVDKSHVGAVSENCGQGIDVQSLESCNLHSSQQVSDVYEHILDIEDDVIVDNTLYCRETSTRVFDLPFEECAMEKEPTSLCSGGCATLDPSLYEQLIDDMKKWRDETNVYGTSENPKGCISYLDALKEYDDEVQKLKANLADEKKRLEEALKKNRRTIWKVVYELETTKRVLKDKTIELAKKTTEVEMIKDLALKDFQVSSQVENKAFELWLAGFCAAKNVIYQFHPELKNDGVEAVGNLMLLCHQ